MGFKKGGFVMNQKLRTKIFERDNYTCQYCGAKDIPTKQLLPAHIRTASLCGDDRESNLITLCRYCYNHVENKNIMQKFETPENAKIFGELFKQRVESYGYEVNYTKKVFASNGIGGTRPQIDRFFKKCMKNKDDFEEFKKELINSPKSAREAMTTCAIKKITYRQYLEMRKAEE